MIQMRKTPRHFIVDLNNTPYQMDLSPVTVGTRQYQAYGALVLGVVAFFSGFAYQPVFTVLAMPLLAWAVFLLYSRYIITYHDNYAEVYSRTPWSEARTETLFFQNYQGVQVGTRDNKSVKKGTPPYNFTITLIHDDPQLNLPLLDLPDSERAYNLSRLYGEMMGVPVLQARLYDTNSKTQTAAA